MKRVFSLLLSLAMLISILSVSQSVALAQSTVSVKVRVGLNYSYENEVLKLVNKERSKRGLTKLKMSKNLFDFAQQRAAELAVMYYYAENGKPHIRPDGSLPQSHKGVVSENSAGSSFKDFTPKEVMEGWMNSKGHRANILTKSFRTIGIGCATSDGCTYWVQVFGTATAKSNYCKKGSNVVTKTVKITKKYCYIQITDSLAEDETPYPDKYYLYTSVQAGPIVDPSCVTYSCSNKNIATVNSKGLIKFKKPGSVKVTVKLKHSSLKTTRTIKYSEPVTMKISKTRYVYNGKNQRPKVSGYSNAKRYKSFEFCYALPKNSKSVGDYLAYGWMEKFDKYDYEFGFDDMKVLYYTPDDEFWIKQPLDEPTERSKSYSKRYTILPKSTRIIATKPTKGTVTIKWAKQNVQTSGYIIQYSTNKNFKAAKSIKVADNSKMVRKIRGLKSGKKYYFRVRTYKKKATDTVFPDEFGYVYNYYGMVIGKYVKTYNSAWSSAKAVKVK